MNLTALAATLLGLLSLPGLARAQAVEPGVRLLTEDAVVAPRLGEPVEFGRYADQARRRTDSPPPVAVRATGSWVPSGALPLEGRGLPPRGRGPGYQGRAPAGAIPAPDLRGRSAEASGTGQGQAAPERGAKPYQIGLAVSLAQNVGVGLILIGLTGPLRRRSSRFSGAQADEDLPPIRA